MYAARRSSRSTAGFLHPSAACIMLLSLLHFFPTLIFIPFRFLPPRSRGITRRKRTFSGASEAFLIVERFRLTAESDRPLRAASSVESEQISARETVDRESPWTRKAWKLESPARPAYDDPFFFSSGRISSRIEQTCTVPVESTLSRWRRPRPHGKGTRVPWPCSARK